MTADRSPSTGSQTLFYQPKPGANERRFILQATDAGCVGSTGRKLMMGGVTTGASLDALEQATGRDLLWSASQFVSAAPSDTDFTIEVDELVAGRNITQARATLLDGERVVLRVSAALGSRQAAPIHCFESMPSAASPEACPRKQSEGEDGNNNLFSQFERRLADEDPDAGTEHLWFRSVDDAPTSTALLAIYADHLAGAHPLTRGSTSLDNTLRVVTLKPTPWVLAATEITAIGPRIFHGSMHLFAEDGTPLATASQTGVLPRRSRT